MIMTKPKGELVLIGTDSNGNPLKRKTGRDIQNCMDSLVFKRRCHGYCQPNFCMFYGGTGWNCNGTTRKGVVSESHITWVKSRSPEENNAVELNRKEAADERRQKAKSSCG